MPSTTATNRKGKVTWTPDVEVGLHLLYSEFQLASRQRVQVFNIVYHQYLSRCGLPQGVTPNIINAQYNERKKPTSRDWASICQPPVSAEDSQRRDSIRARIRDAISALSSQGSARPSNTTQRDRPASGGSTLDAAVAPTPPGRTSRSSKFRSAIANAAYDHPSTPTPVTRSSAIVVIPAKPSTTQLRTPPSKSPRSTQYKTPKIAFRRNDGSTIMVSPKAFKAIQTRVQAVPEHKARPPLPALLFRFWHEDPQCDRNSEQGFWARKYHKSNVIPHMPPKSTNIDPVDIFNHMDRQPEKTPFISTSSRLIWIVQLLLKGVKDGTGSGRLSIIDTSALDKRTVFHARPFHDEIIKTHGFSKGAQRYHGTYEWMIWRKIPAHAIIHTFKAEDLLNFADSHPAVRAALQFEILHLPGKSLARTKIPMLQEGSVHLTIDIVIGLSQLCVFFGLDAHSRIEHISHIIMDVVEGWSLKVDHREEQEWYQLATVFAKNMSRQSTQPVTFQEQESVKLAFLNGVAWGCGTVNATHSTALIEAKARKASAAGLRAPARIIANQLDAAKLAVLAFEKTQTRRLEMYHEQFKALPAGIDDDYEQDEKDEADSLDDGDVDMEVHDAEPTAPVFAAGAEDEIMYEND